MSKSKKIVESFPVYIPCSVDIESLLIQYPTGIANSKDKLHLLMGLIHSVPAYQKHDDIEDEQGYTILHSKYLEKAVDEYAPLFNWLIQQGIVERYKSYIPGITSKGYRFAEDYCTELKRVHITNGRLIAKIKAGRNKTSDKPKLCPENLVDVSPEELSSQLSYKQLAKFRLSHLENWYANELTIDNRLAEQFLRKQFEEDKKYLTYRKAMNRLTRAQIVAEAFNAPDRRFLVDDTAGRLHTLLTCLKSPLRAFLSYAGKPLISVDIRNSQPLLSLALLDEKLFRHNKMLERISIYNEKFKSESFGEGIYSGYYIMLGNLIKDHSEKPDLLKYKEIVVEGHLYEYFGQRLQELGFILQGLHHSQVRVETKKAVLKSLFNTNQAIGRDHLQRAFQQVFPSVYEIFQFIKSGNHRTLACVLQNLEAEIVLHRACKEIAVLNPEAPLFTIHDSIASTPENTYLVKEVLSKHIFEALGIIPSLETEPWNIEYLQKKLNKYSYNMKINSDTNANEAPIGYGYVDPEIFFIPLYPSLTQFAKENILRRNTFFEALRKLGIIQQDRNLPVQEFENAKLLVPYSFMKKSRNRRRAIHLSTTKITYEGSLFLLKIIKEHPALFPKIRTKPEQS